MNRTKTADDPVNETGTEAPKGDKRSLRTAILSCELTANQNEQSHAGGMPPISLAEPTGRYLSFAEREEIAIMRAKGKGVREIARALERDPGTISRELRRNAATRGGTQEYRATVAQWKAQQAAKRPKVALHR